MAAVSTDIPEGLELVAASGVCSFCDRRFWDEQVLAYKSSTFPGGVGYIEVRHLYDTDFHALWGPQARSRPREGCGRGSGSQ